MAAAAPGLFVAAPGLVAAAPGLFVAVLATALWADAGSAQSIRHRGPIECGSVYTILRGDTLHRVAVRAYGPDASYRILWRYNRERLATADPSLIEIGQQVLIPCLDVDDNPLPVPEAVLARLELDQAAAEHAEREAQGPVYAQTDVRDADAGQPEVVEPEDVQAEVVDALSVSEQVAAASTETTAAAAPPPAAPAPPPDGAAAVAAAPMTPPADAAPSPQPPRRDAGEPAVATVSAGPRLPEPEAAPPSPAAPRPLGPDAETVDVAPPAAPDVPSAPAMSATPPPPAPPPTERDVAVAAGRATTAPPTAALQAQAEPQPPAPTPTVLVTGGPSVAAAVAGRALAANLPSDAFVVRPDAPGASGLRLPVAAPACGAPGPCGDVLVSQPLVETTIVALVPPDAPDALDASTACRAGLASPDAAAPDALACAEAVAAGAASHVLALAEDADALLADPDAPMLVERWSMARRVALRAAADPDDPVASALLTALDEGLATLKAEAGLFAVVDAHFAASGQGE